MRYLQISRVYIVVLTIFVVARFTLEALGADDDLTSEISVTRLLFLLPVFLGGRFVREELGGILDMLLANLAYVFWAVLLIQLAGLLEATLGTGTHYMSGPPLSILGTFLYTVVLGSVLTTLICWVTALIYRRICGSSD